MKKSKHETQDMEKQTPNTTRHGKRDMTQNPKTKNHKQRTTQTGVMTISK